MENLKVISLFKPKLSKILIIFALNGLLIGSSIVSVDYYNNLQDYNNEFLVKSNKIIFSNIVNINNYMLWLENAGEFDAILNETHSITTTNSQYTIGILSPDDKYYSLPLFNLIYQNNRLTGIGENETYLNFYLFKIDISTLGILIKQTQRFTLYSSPSIDRKITQYMMFIDLSSFFVDNTNSDILSSTYIVQINNDEYFLKNEIVSYFNDLLFIVTNSNSTKVWQESGDEIVISSRIKEVIYSNIMIKKNQLSQNQIPEKVYGGETMFNKDINQFDIIKQLKTDMPDFYDIGLQSASLKLIDTSGRLHFIGRSIKNLEFSGQGNYTGLNAPDYVLIDFDKGRQYWDLFPGMGYSGRNILTSEVKIMEKSTEEFLVLFSFASINGFYDNQRYWDLSDTFNDTFVLDWYRSSSLQFSTFNPTNPTSENFIQFDDGTKNLIPYPRLFSSTKIPFTVARYLKFTFSGSFYSRVDAQLKIDDQSLLVYIPMYNTQQGLNASIYYGNSIPGLSLVEMTYDLNDNSLTSYKIIIGPNSKLEVGDIGKNNGTLASKFDGWTISRFAGIFSRSIDDKEETLLLVSARYVSKYSTDLLEVIPSKSFTMAWKKL